MANGRSVINSDMKQLLQLLVLSLLFSSCNQLGDCFHGTGAITDEERSLDTIRRIYLTSNINLIIHPNQSYFRMRLSGGNNLLENVDTEVENGTLSIKNKNHCNWVRSFKSKITVEVWVDKLNALYLENSTGEVTTEDTIRTDNFRVDCFGSMGNVNLLIDCGVSTIALHNGPSDITVRGRCGVQYNYNAGFGKIDCRSLYSDDVYIKNKGTNDTWINSQSLLEATIERDGNIYYTGNPSTIKTLLNGKGQLIKI